MRSCDWPNSVVVAVESMIVLLIDGGDLRVGVVLVLLEVEVAEEEIVEGRGGREEIME